MNLKDSLEILRPINCLMGSLTILIGILNTRIGISYPILTINIIFGVITYFFLAGSGMIINDYYDIEIDKINRPERPIPRGSISLRQAKTLYFICLAIGLFFSLFHFLTLSLNYFTIVIAVVFGFIGWLYAKWGKRNGFFGNLIVSISFSIGIIYGALLNTTFIPIYIFFFFFTSFSLLMSREIIKGCEDIEGDKKEGVRTLAIRIGIKKSIFIAFAFGLIAIYFYILPLYQNIINSLIYIILMVFGIIIVATSLFIMLRSELSKKNFKMISLLLKIGAFIGLLTFLLASI